ncbi:MULTISPECIES: hypothetical protein [Bacteroidales]|uniref:hypothetical protein n=1 Tax=Bacteroidales TaxID=171549 RepID=UPI00124716E0|nr:MULTISPECIES: hypothetical protein [Bacteroidales]
MNNITKIICYLFFTLSISCAPSKEEKAQNLIRASLNQMLPNIESYEAIEFGEFEPAKICFQETDEAFTLLNELQEISDNMEQEIDNAKCSYNPVIAEKHLETFKNLDIQFKALSDSINKRSEAFHYDTTMVSIFHKFRYYDDKRKCYQIIPMTFYFDKNITKIKGVKYLYNDDSGPEIYSEMP